MLMATQDSVRFAHTVGVAPSTTTMQLGGPPQMLASIQGPRYYMPYASLEDLRSSNAGLGIVNESDAWMTGRPYGLPGTATVQLLQRPGGYKSPDGMHYDARMFGDTDATLMQLVEQQRVQAQQLKRIAFWQALGGGIALGATVLTVALGVASYVRSR